MAKTIQSYRDLIAWQKAIALVTEVYELSKLFPKEEIFGITSQIRRASVSIPSNIAEGHAKSSSKEYQLFLSHAKGSLAELETQVVIAKNLNYLGEREAHFLLELCGELSRIISGLLSSLRKR